jgi:calcineurin-like phosphoesterase family protein
MKWFSSDHHFGHKNVITYCNRPFKDEIEMTWKLIEAWNSVVKPDDEVFYLGDFSLADKYARDITHRLSGKKYLIMGNHDEPHPAKCKGNTEKMEKHMRRYKSWGWDEVCLERSLVIGHDSLGILVRLCHLPYTEPPDTGEDQRHTRWRLPDDGTPLICGHIHEKWRSRRTAKGTKMVNVGVDAWPGFKPVSELDVLREVLAGGL